MAAKAEKVEIDVRSETCTRHGEYIGSWQEPGPGGKLHWVGVPDCPECTKERRMKKYSSNACIPELYKDCSFENYVVYSCKYQEYAKRVLQRYAFRFDGNSRNTPNILLTGSYGTGKDHLAYSILKQIMNNGHSGLVLDYKDFLSEVWRRKFDAIDYLEKLCEPDLLVINEIGRASKGTAAGDELFNLLNKRLQSLKPFVLVSNYDSEDLKEVWGDEGYEAIMERVRGETKTPIQLHLEWESFRSPRFENN